MSAVYCYVHLLFLAYVYAQYTMCSNFLDNIVYTLNMDYVLYFIIAAAIFAIIDLVWLGVVAKNFYRNQLGSLFAKKIKLWPAVVFYALYIVGLLYFGVQPAIEDDSAMTALRNGALFGLFAYATYDFTNWATLEKWPGAKLSIVDTLWGTILTASTTVLTFFISQSI